MRASACPRPVRGVERGPSALPPSASVAREREQPRPRPVNACARAASSERVAMRDAPTSAETRRAKDRASTALSSHASEETATCVHARLQSGSPRVLGDLCADELTRACSMRVCIRAQWRRHRTHLVRYHGQLRLPRCGDWSRFRRPLFSGGGAGRLLLRPAQPRADEQKRGRADVAARQRECSLRLRPAKQR